MEDNTIMYASSRERFSVTDIFAKGTPDCDVDTLNSVRINGEQRSLRLSTSVDGSHLVQTSAFSRFRIVPLESKYKRGRWNCFDYYDKDANKEIKTRVPDIAPLKQTSNHCCIVRSLQPDHQIQSQTIHSSKNCGESSESDRENNEIFARSTPTFSRTVKATTPQANWRSNKSQSFSQTTACNEKNTGFRRLFNRTNDEKLQKGLEKSLSPEVGSGPRRIDLGSSSHSSIMNGLGQAPSLAIDSKIEQAMDLVKTHLMFAVREEVDVLRGKISDLESHIFRLESENAILKANIPEEVLRSITIGGHPS